MQLILNIFLCIIYIALAIMALVCLIYNILTQLLYIVPILRCRGIKDCTDDTCPYRITCRRKKLTKWEKTPFGRRVPPTKEKKPSNLWRIYQWFQDLLL